MKPTETGPIVTAPLKKRDALAAGRELITAQARPCWVPAVTKDGNGLSQYFGSPWLANSEEWPSILGQPAQFVLQLDLAVLPTDMQALTGNAGLLQLFYQPDDRIEIDWDKGTSQLGFVRVVDHAATIGSHRAQPKIHGYAKKQARYISGWNERLDYPHSEEYAALGFAEELDRIATSSGLFDDDFAGTKYFALQGDKLGGWPFWTQAVEYPNDSSGEAMMLLYQVDAGSFYDGPHVKAHAKHLFASDGTGHIFISRNNPRELRFEWATG